MIIRIHCGRALDVEGRLERREEKILDARPFFPAHGSSIRAVRQPAKGIRAAPAKLTRESKG